MIAHANRRHSFIGASGLRFSCNDISDLAVGAQRQLSCVGSGLLDLFDDVV
jgi:hypothetical protein